VQERFLETVLHLAMPVLRDALKAARARSTLMQ
jgi:hypothetical protein